MKPVLSGKSLCLILDSGELFARNITAYLSYPGEDFNVLTAGSSGEWKLEGNTARSDNVTIEFIPKGRGVLVRTAFRNQTGRRLEDPGQLYSFECTLERPPKKMLCNRFTDDNGNLVNEMRSQIDTIYPVWGAKYDSADFTAYTSDAGSGIFGYASFERYFGAVSAGGDGRFSAYQFLEQHPLEPEGVVISDLVLVTPCGDIAKEGLPEYARLVAELSAEEASPRREFDIPVGFCTWYYYASKISSEIMRENMDSLDAHKEDIPVKYIQVDDGWFDCWGNWEPKENFDCDMKTFAGEVKDRGYLPGIWVAPFGASTGSRIFEEHPEYFVQMKCGQPWPKPAFDFSRPETCEFIGGLFHKLSHDWGYRYIKMDIITGTLAPGVYHDPEFTTIRNFRRGLQVIRKAVTEDTFLLACTAPLAPAAGLVDGMRVSCDVFERWQSLRDVFNSVIKRYYMHKTWYINDADCLLVRTAAEEDEQCWRLCTRTEREIRTYVTAMAASGGALMLSDKLPLLREEQYRLISYLFPLNKEAALPLDLMDSFIPGVLDFGMRQKTRTVALINWGDAEAELLVPGSVGKLAFEFWEQKFLGLCTSDIAEVVEPHGCRVYFLTEPADEAAVGTDSSIVMDIKTSAAAGGRLEYVKNKPGERLCIARSSSEGYDISWE